MFGFPEFLAGLALMVLAWTIADVRYRFRVRTAPLPLQGLTFTVVAIVGLLTLLTDLWRAENWLVPRGIFLTPASWQTLLAGIFLLTFLTWAWFAFIRPPVFSKINAERYARSLYRSIVRGSPSELAVIADELTNSVANIVRYSSEHNTNRTRPDRHRAQPKVEAYATELLFLIADKRFCRVIIEYSPATALAIFHETSKTRKYGIPIKIFARNLVTEAFINEDSFLYHEAEGYESGLLGYQKPLSQAMFANYELVEEVRTLLDIRIRERMKWKADQWEIYCRLVMMVFRNYVKVIDRNRSYTLYYAMENIQRSVNGLYKLDGQSNIWQDDELDRLINVVRFITDMVDVLHENRVSDHNRLRLRNEFPSPTQSFYDHLANMILEVIFAASTIKSPQDPCWVVQHNFLWHKLFNFNSLDHSEGNIVKFKVRRLIYDEIKTNKTNFRGARFLRFCLNVLGLKLNKSQHNKDSYALHKAILSWTKTNYAWLHNYNPNVAEACLVDGFAYDSENHRLVRTYAATGLRRTSERQYFSVDPPPPDGADISE